MKLKIVNNLKIAEITEIKETFRFKFKNILFFSFNFYSTIL